MLLKNKKKDFHKIDDLIAITNNLTIHAWKFKLFKK